MGYAETIWELSVLSAHLCCKPKTVLKIDFSLLKELMTHKNVPDMLHFLLLFLRNLYTQCGA